MAQSSSHSDYRPLEHILSLLDGVRDRSSGWAALCPAHDDKRPSLNITEGDDGRVLLHCHAGCEPDDILTNIGLEMKDLYPAEKPVVYSYQDEKRQLLFQVIRHPGKQFAQRRPGQNGNWIYNLANVRRVPFRLRELLRAIRNNRPVFIVEGEKDVRNLATLGVAATTNPGGAGAWRPDYNPFFDGAQVVILPDNDDAGRRHGEQVAAQLHGVARSVRIVALPHLPETGDVSDWIDAGGTKQRLLKLSKATPRFDPMSNEVTDCRFRFITATEIETRPAPPFLVHGMIPLNAVVQLHGPPGSGKTFLALSIAACVTTGRSFLKRKVKRGLVVYVIAEGVTGLGVRLRALLTHWEVGDIPDLLFCEEPVSLLDKQSVDDFLAAMDRLPKSPTLIVLDTLSRCIVGGDENSAKDMTVAVAAMDRIKKATGATVLPLHHPRKRDNVERGSSVLRGALDCMISLRNTGRLITIQCEKMKDAAAFRTEQVSLIPCADSCVIGPPELADYFEGELHPRNRDLLDALADFSEDGATSAEWCKTVGMKTRTFHNHRSWLCTTGYVEKIGGQRGRYVLTKDARDLLTATCQISAMMVPSHDQ